MDFSRLITGNTSTKITSTCHWQAASRYAQSSDIQTVENNVQYNNAYGVTIDSTRTERLRVTTHGQDRHPVTSH